MPAACESTMFVCRRPSSSSGMRVCERRPKPVLIPYAGFPEATIRWTDSKPALQRRQARRVELERGAFPRDPAQGGEIEGPGDDLHRCMGSSKPFSAAQAIASA